MKGIRNVRHGKGVCISDRLSSSYEDALLGLKELAEIAKTCEAIAYSPYFNDIRNIECSDAYNIIEKGVMCEIYVDRDREITYSMSFWGIHGEKGYPDSNEEIRYGVQYGPEKKRTFTQYEVEEIIKEEGSK